MQTSQRWDVTALRMGATVSLVFAIPFSLGASWAASRNSTTLAIWLVLGAVGGFTLGSGCAAWVQRLDLPLSHGLVTATGTYSATQALFIAVQLVTGGSVNWFGAFFNLSVVAGVGLVGGWIGRRLRAKGFVPSFERSGQ
jgi:hypothetical protein